jgi:hypothetical protein
VGDLDRVADRTVLDLHQQKVRQLTSYQLEKSAHSIDGPPALVHR